MFDNSKIESKGGNYLGAGIHTVYVFDIESEEIFTNRNGEERKKITVMFKDESGSIHFEDFLIMDSTMWRLKLLSVACGIGEDETWDWKDLQGKQLKIHLKESSYTDKGGEKRMKCEIYKFEPYNPETTDYPDSNTKTEDFKNDPF